MAVDAFSTTDIRVHDYLNDKLQTESDLNSIDSLLETVQQQQELLRKQLEEANDALHAATVASEEHFSALQSKTSLFVAEQDDLDRRLMDLTHSNTSDEAVKKFEANMEELQKLDVAIGYMEILQQVETLRLDARKDAGQSPKTKTARYNRLKQLLTFLEDAQPAAEGAAPHLLDHVEQQSNRMFSDLEGAFGDDLTKTLNAMAWPENSLKLDDGLISSFTYQVGLLLDLQEPDLKAWSLTAQDRYLAAEPPILLPLEVMARPLVLRFKYHFSGNRPTNRLDKPEYFLSNVLDILETHNDFLVGFLQPVLDRRSQQVAQDFDLPYTDATSAFITSLLPMAREKLLALLPQIKDNPNLLSHLMNELMRFDDTLRDSWGYTPNPSALESWKGLTWEVLVTYSYFEAWLQVEKTFALSRYRTIIAADDSGDIDYDSLETSSTKPSKGAIRVNDLLETITDRYRPLFSFSQKLRFLIDIQLEIFDQYHNRLSDSLENYLVRTSTLGRATMTTDQNSQTIDLSGIVGLERLCRVFGSAAYLEDKMSDWSEDIFFLELWDELLDRSKQNSGTGRSVARDLSTAQIAAKTSASVANGTEDVDESTNGALFDETASAYRHLRLRSETILKETLDSNIRSALRLYSKVASWSSLSVPSSSQTPSPELDPVLHVLTTQLSFLTTVLSPIHLRRIARQVCVALQDFLLDRILNRNTFSAAGAAQLSADVSALCAVIGRSINIGDEAASMMRKLLEGVRLVSLPIRAAGQRKGGRVQETVEDEGEEDAWDLDDGEAGTDESGNDGEPEVDADGEKVWGLWEVEKRLFKSNEEAREVLSEMGVEFLDVNEARNLLKRRVEVGS